MICPGGQNGENEMGDKKPVYKSAPGNRFSYQFPSPSGASHSSVASRLASLNRSAFIRVQDSVRLLRLVNKSRVKSAKRKVETPKKRARTSGAVTC